MSIRSKPLSLRICLSLFAGLFLFLISAPLFAQGDLSITFMPMEQSQEAQGPKQEKTPEKLPPRIAAINQDRRVTILGLDELPIKHLALTTPDGKPQPYDPQSGNLTIEQGSYLQTNLAGQTLRLWNHSNYNSRFNLYMLPFGDDSAPDIIKADVQVLMPDGSPAKGAWVWAALVVRVRGFDQWSHIQVQTNDQGVARLRMPTLIQDLIGKPAPPLWIDFMAQGPDGSNLVAPPLHWTPGQPMVMRFQSAKPRRLRMVDKGVALPAEEAAKLELYQNSPSLLGFFQTPLNVDLSKPLLLPDGDYSFFTGYSTPFRIDANSPYDITIDRSLIPNTRDPLSNYHDQPVGARIRGRVTDPDGKPVPDCHLLITPVAPGANPSRLDTALHQTDYRDVVSSPDGSFTLWPANPIDAPESIVTVVPPEGSRLSPQALRAKPGDNLQVQLQKTRPIIVNEPLSPDFFPSGVYFDLFKIDAQSRTKLRLDSVPNDYSLSHLADGQYRLESSGRVTPTATLASGQSRLKFTPLKDIPFTFRVFDRVTGKPVQGALIVRNRDPEMSGGWSAPAWKAIVAAAAERKLTSSLLHGYGRANGELTPADYALSDAQGRAVIEGLSFDENNEDKNNFLIFAPGQMPMIFRHSRLKSLGDSVAGPPEKIEIDVPLVRAAQVVFPSDPTESRFSLNNEVWYDFDYQPPATPAPLGPWEAVPRFNKTGGTLIPAQGKLRIISSRHGHWSSAFSHRPVDFDYQYESPAENLILNAANHIDLAFSPFEVQGADSTNPQMTRLAVSGPLLVRAMNIRGCVVNNARINAVLTYLPTQTPLFSQQTWGRAVLRVPAHCRLTITVTLAGQTLSNPDWVFEAGERPTFAGPLTLLIPDTPPAGAPVTDSKAGVP